ncbi:MAG: ABC transporter ATP-binding protein [Actinomycetota bacterium]
MTIAATRLGTEPVIRTFGLTKHYGRTVALADLDLEIPPGTVFGYLGPNGAGKTTTIRVLMGLLRPTRGRAEIFGLDAQRDRGAIHRRAGYVPGEFVAYPDLLAEQYLRYVASLRGGVVWSDVELLAKRLDLDFTGRIGAMSHGNRQKVGLIQGFMHHPELLILDEPSIGLDPLMQREFESIVREAHADGRTVFLSSHFLHEVEELADVVGILRRGRMVVVESVAALKAKAVRRLDLMFTRAPPVSELRRVRGVSDIQVEGSTARVVVEGSMEELLKVAAPHGIRNVVTHEVDLEEIFLGYYGEGS